MAPPRDGGDIQLLSLSKCSVSYVAFRQEKQDVKQLENGNWQLMSYTHSLTQSWEILSQKSHSVIKYYKRFSSLV